MISKVHLVNLQSHADTELDLHPGINVITGPSDIGKSAITRALRWAARNKPSGDNLRRHKTKETKVIIDSVTKMRTASKHQYEMDGKIFKAIRTDVPPLVQETLNLTEINFQEQHQTYFLIADSPGQVAKTLNEVADLQIIDLSLQEVKRRVRDSRTEKKFLEEQIGNHEEKISDLQWAMEADRLYQKVESCEAVAETSKAAADQLDERLITHQERSQEFFRIPDSAEDKVKIETLSSDLEEDSSLKDAVFKVEKNQVDIPVTREDILLIDGLLPKLNTTPEFSLTESITSAITAEKKFSAIPLIVDPSTVLDSLTHVDAEVRALEDAMNKVLIAEDCFDYAEVEVRQAKVEFDEKMSELGVCPMCEGKV